jgi:hypothetical protein
MKIFLVRIACFFLIIFGFYLFLETVINKNISTPNSRFYVQFDWFDNKNHNSKILALGNSRTWWHLDPFSISKSTRKSCEILSANGQGTTIVYQKLINYLKYNKTPELIILQFDAHFLSNGGTMFESFNWSPGYFLNRIEFGGAKKFKGYKDYFTFMPIWGIDRKTRIKILTNDKIGPDSSFNKHRGYFPSYQKWDSRVYSSVVSVPNIENYFDSIISFAKRKKIGIILLTSPYSPIVNQMNPSIREDLKISYDKICKKYATKFHWIDLQNVKGFSDTIFFADNLHLNLKGSQKLSQIVGENLNILNVLK